MATSKDGEAGGKGEGFLLVSSHCRCLCATKNLRSHHHCLPLLFSVGLLTEYLATYTPGSTARPFAPILPSLNRFCPSLVSKLMYIRVCLLSALFCPLHHSSNRTPRIFRSVRCPRSSFFPKRPFIPECILKRHSVAALTKRCML